MKNKSYSTISHSPSEKADQAKQLNGQALAAIQDRNWKVAEELLDKALAIDVNYGPAHNNLGQVYLARHQLYLAAWEFEFARNLMPERVEPHVNLGLVYETAMQHETAKEHYELAHEVDPSNSDAIALLARICVKLDEPAERIHWLLNQIVMRDGRRPWVVWAKDLLATKYRLQLTSGGSQPPIASQTPEDWQAEDSSPVQLQLLPRIENPEPSELEVPEPVSLPPPVPSPSDQLESSSGVSSALPLDLSRLSPLEHLGLPQVDRDAIPKQFPGLVIPASAIQK